MSIIIHATNPDRALTDVVIKDWPIILTSDIAYGYLPVHPAHHLNMTNKHEIHISYRSYYDLVIYLGAYEHLEKHVEGLNKLIGHVESDPILSASTLNEDTEH